MTAPNSVAALVRERVCLLQAGYVTPRRRSSVVADLAQLRRATSAPPGTVPQVWELTSVPWVDDADTRVGEDPTPEEVACHAAMTLYALHQQSQTEQMHKGPQKGRPGPSLGLAVAQLIQQADHAAQRRDPDRVSSLRRRFNALVTASTTTELVHHLRGLVHQLRSESIALDYGRLAEDLLDLQDPRCADGVRRRWARDLAGFRTDPDDPAAGDQPSPGQDPGTGPVPPSPRAASGPAATAQPSDTDSDDIEETW